MYEDWVKNEKNEKPEVFFENLNRLRRRKKAARMLFAHEVDKNGLKVKHGDDLSALRRYLEEHYRPAPSSLAREKPDGRQSPEEVDSLFKTPPSSIELMELLESEERAKKEIQDFKLVEEYQRTRRTGTRTEDVLGEVARRQLNEMFAGVPQIEMLACRAYADQRIDRGRLKSFIENRDQSFSETLLALIEKKGMTNSQCYRAAQVDRKLFSKIRKDPLYVPAKSTALALVMALKLDICEAEALLAKAGYALSRASVFDLAVRYFIENEMYDVLKANEMLYALDQRLLGGRWK